MKSKSNKKNSSQKNSTSSKLISIRMPSEMVSELRKEAKKKGDLGYQRLIKHYVAGGLTDSRDGVGSQESEIMAVKTGSGKKASSTHYPQLGAKIAAPNQALEANSVISEDIKELAQSLKSYYSHFEGKRFLITGAFGFLGKYMVHLFRYLNQKIFKTNKIEALLLDNFVTGYEQQVVLDPHLRFIRHNVIDAYNPDGKVDYILHMAGIASPAYYTKYPIETMDVGTIGTRNMLELAVKKNVKSFLFTSSSEVYGDPDPKYVPTTEEYHGNVSVNGPRSCYDESKRFGETMCTAFYRVYGLPIKIVRPFNVYGPGIRPDDYRVLPNFIEHALRKEPLPIHGQGINTRSFCYIADAIESIFRVLFSPAHGEAFNIGNPSPEISIEELAQHVAKAMPYKVNIVKIKPPHAVYATSDPKRRCPDISKLQKITGFKPRYDLNKGLKRTIRWFSER